MIPRNVSTVCREVCWSVLQSTRPHDCARLCHGVGHVTGPACFLTNFILAAFNVNVHQHCPTPLAFLSDASLLTRFQPCQHITVCPPCGRNVSSQTHSQGLMENTNNSLRFSRFLTDPTTDATKMHCGGKILPPRTIGDKNVFIQSTSSFWGGFPHRVSPPNPPFHIFNCFVTSDITY